MKSRASKKRLRRTLADVFKAVTTKAVLYKRTISNDG